MERPEGFEETGQRPVCKLKRSLYGLKQSPGQWHKRFNGFVLKMGCRRCDYVCCVCVRSLDGRDSIFLLLYDDEILRYLRGTGDWNIMFSREQSVPSVAWYVDSDYVGDRDDRRSTTGYVFTLTGGPICWKSSVQPIVAMSRTEAEYMAVAEAAKEALWLTGLVRELGVEQGGVRLHENAADMLTKLVTSDKFKYCLNLLHRSQ